MPEPPIDARAPGASSGRRREMRGSVLLLAGLVAVEAALLYLGLAGDSPLVGLVPALAGLYVLAAYRWPDLAVALAFLAAPVSFQAALPGGVFVAFPTEPMIALALLARAVRALAGLGLGAERRPLTLPLAAYLAATLLSCATGEDPLLSLKAWIVLLGYAAFGFLAFTGYGRACRRRWVVIAAAAAAAVGGYGVVRLLVEGISSRAGYGIGRPFFSEHGTYSAYLAMFTPLLLLEALDHRGRARLLFASSFLLALAGVVLSFTRAAWLALAIVLPLTVVLWAIRTGSLRRLAVPAVWAAALTVLVVATGLSTRLSRHAMTAVDPENVSNLERLNRWMAGWEMARSHLWTGVGYDGFGASYASYRRKVIVTGQTYVRMGVHSEPLRALSETGLLGLAAGCWLVWAVGAAGLRTFRQARDPARSRLALGVTAGLGTYFVHGWLNAYPGSDKVGLAVWMGIGAIAAIAKSGDRAPS